MKTIITSIILSNSLNTIPVDRSRENTLDIQQTSHYTGCIDGFLALQELGLYKRPDSMTPHQVFKAVKDDCIKKSFIYRKEQENFWGK